MVRRWWFCPSAYWSQRPCLDRELGGHFSLIQISSQWGCTGHGDCSMIPPGQGSNFKSLHISEDSLQSYLTRKLGQRMWAAMWPLLEPCLKQHLSRNHSKQLCPSGPDLNLVGSFCLIQVSYQCALLAVESALTPCLGMEANSQPWSTARSSCQTHATRDPSSLSPSCRCALGKELSQQPCLVLKCSFWSHKTRKSKQWPLVASEPNLHYNSAMEPSLHPCHVTETSQ